MSLSLRETADQAVHAFDHSAHAVAEFIGETKDRFGELASAAVVKPAPKRSFPFGLLVALIGATGAVVFAVRWGARRSSAASSPALDGHASTKPAADPTPRARVAAVG